MATNASPVTNAVLFCFMPPLPGVRAPGSLAKSVGWLW
jgi:hypothetical protein